jgi:hypothetical protein
MSLGTTSIQEQPHGTSHRHHLPRRRPRRRRRGMGAVNRRRSIAVALVALGVAGLAALLSYYALVESQSAPWALGYGVVAVLSAAVCGRHIAGRLLKSRG